MGGRLEHEIRLLPQVLSCSFAQDDYVVVLIDPSGDPWTIRLAVERILQKARSGAAVRIIGPAESTAAAATRTISPLVATATVATVAAIGIGALAGGLAAVEQPKAPSHRPPAAIATAAPLETPDAVRGPQITPPERGTPVERVSLPIEAPDQARQASAATFVSAARTMTPRTIVSRVRPVQAQSEGEPTEAAELGATWHNRHGRHLRYRASLLSRSVLLPIRQREESDRDTR